RRTELMRRAHTIRTSRARWRRVRRIISLSLSIGFRTRANLEAPSHRFAFLTRRECTLPSFAQSAAPARLVPGVPTPSLNEDAEPGCDDEHDCERGRGKTPHAQS